MTQHVVIFGAGPAGLAAAWEARRHNLSCEVLEKDHCVGGLSRTVNYKGYRFDIGGHRFFTKNIEVNAFWQEILKDDFISVNRLSRIYYNNRFFYYPLKPMNAFLGLGPIASVQILLSYVKARMAPLPEENTFEQWVTNRFGRKLYETFFKTYTEKVWGIPCSQIGAEWAAQRIKGLSLTSAVKNALFGSRGNRVKTLISTFQYPKEGPGMMYSAASDSIRSSGGDVSLNSEVMAIHHAEGRIREITVRDPESGRTRRLGGDQFLSSMPITHLVERLVPAPPDPVLRAAHSLKYRALLVVNLVLRRKNLFPDNWVYVHSPQVRLGRLQNYKNWSPWMIDNQEHTSLGLEYFCNEGDDLWTMPNEQLIELGGREIQTLGLARVSDVMDGFVYRAPFTYCVYDTGYEQHMKIVREYLARFPNLHPIGRAGMFKYNNMDHSILTGFLAVRNIMGARHDLWSVNADQDYHEEDRGSET